MGSWVEGVVRAVMDGDEPRLERLEPLNGEGGPLTKSS